MANETRIFRIPPNMPVQAVASHVDHYLRAPQRLQKRLPGAHTV